MKELKMPDEYTYIAAFLTMRCNLNCSFCLNAFEKRFSRKQFQELDGKDWVNALNRIISKPQIPVTLSGGEPFLHKDFIYIINNIKPDLNIDILTNLQWGERGIERFISEVDPNRIKRDSPYASIRVSYHPEQMGNGEELVKNVKKLKDRGFSIGIWAVLYPSQEHLSAINQMQFRCIDNDIDFRLKEFTGKYKSELYGDYSRYPRACFSEVKKSCLCRISELIIGPNGDVYRCHRDLYARENPTGNILNEDFKIRSEFRQCDNYGECHPCDVKVKTNYKQQRGYTSVEIKDLK